MVLLWILVGILLIVGVVGVLGSTSQYTNESWNDEMEKHYDEERWVKYYNKYEKHKR
jgi:hypothetical protein